MTQKIRPAKPTGSVTTSSWEMFHMKGFIANDDLLKSDHKILNSPCKGVGLLGQYWGIWQIKQSSVMYLARLEI
jgi:hypothetical protein